MLATQSPVVNCSSPGRSPFSENSQVPSWPNELPEEALYGLAGDVVRTIEPHTEADPAALLVQFLVGIGNVIGRGRHFIADGARHGLNLFTVLVGVTSRREKEPHGDTFTVCWQRVIPAGATNAFRPD